MVIGVSLLLDLGSNAAIVICAAQQSGESEIMLAVRKEILTLSRRAWKRTLAVMASRMSGSVTISHGSTSVTP